MPGEESGAALSQGVSAGGDTDGEQRRDAVPSGEGLSNGEEDVTELPLTDVDAVHEHAGGDGFGEAAEAASAAEGDRAESHAGPQRHQASLRERRNSVFVRVRLDGADPIVDFPSTDIARTRGAIEHIRTAPMHRTPLNICRYYEGSRECVSAERCLFAHILTRSRGIPVKSSDVAVPYLNCSENVLLVRGVNCSRANFVVQWQRVPGFLTASLLRSPEGHYGHVYGLVEFVGHEAALRALLSSPADQHVSFWGMSELYVDALTQLELFSEHYPASLSDAPNENSQGLPQLFESPA
ncbi:hypothetical protein DIPPA_34782 [Diplonema papillatum]|nr:hypothetical protein DIPPA_34782 [Diplonema papillatum]